MHLTRTQDPFRFLKRKRNATPSKCHTLQSGQDLITPSCLQSETSRLQDSSMLRGRQQASNYDPAKYYSSKCEQYLRLVRFEVGKVQTSQSQQDSKPERKQNEKKAVQVFKTQEKDAKKYDLGNRIQGREITFKKIEFEQPTSNPPSDTAKPQIGLFNEQDYEIVEGQLQQCPTCLRKFNPTSFDKHIKVCEKVFAKKRKPFSSEKQRSLSKQAKK